MATFLLEVGTEELPASFVDEALGQWKRRIPQSLTEYSLSRAVEVYGTPRRLAVLIEDLPVQQPDQEEEIKGPPAQAAFKDNQPTKAAEGFARSRNVRLEDLEIRTTDKGAFVFVRRKIVGRPTVEILTDLVPQWILELEGKRFMRWGDGDLRFSRPIRWLVALLDQAVLPIELVNGSETIKSDRISQGHRVLHPQPVCLDHAIDYVQCLDNAFVKVNRDSRQEIIRGELGGVVDLYPDLLSEVTNLVEWPTVVSGSFDPAFLSLPREVIITVMITHQRYFPVFEANGVATDFSSLPLKPRFTTISNGDPKKSATIIVGNERVIRARLADAQFFYQADQAIPLEDYLPRLQQVTFQEDLGSMWDKVQRLSQIAYLIADQLQVEQERHTLIQRTASLCKADLVTQMVGEFPELQGFMGQEYALTSGESQAVATAIFEHYLPRRANDILPESLPGQVVGLADRLDTLVSIFGLGQLPTGSSDPFGLRRSANAIVSITWKAELPINLGALLQQISAEFVQTYAKSQPLEVLQQQLNDFFLQRVRSLLQEDWKIDYDLVNAVLGEADPEYAERALGDLLDVRDRARFLQAMRTNGTLAKIYETVNRAARLAGQGNLETNQLDPTAVIQPQLFQQPSEHAFYAALVQLVPQTQAAHNQRDYSQLVSALGKIAPTVSRFFDGPESVLVMDANPDIRRNRLNLLGLLRNHARVLADFGAIVKG